MNIQYLQIGAVVSLFLLCLIKLYILSNLKAWKKSGRVAALWVVMYVFFLFILRFLSLVHIGTLDQLRIVSAIATYIPLLAVCIHLFLFRSAEEEESDIGELLKQARQILAEAKLTRVQAESSLTTAKKTKK